MSSLRPVRRLAAWLLTLALSSFFSGPSTAFGAVPPLLHYQGRVLVDGRVFDGTGHFKFALVNADGSQTWWRNAPDADADGEPDAAVEIPVARGLYALLLGDPALPSMAVLPPAALEHGEVFLRVWFSDGTAAFERFVPDHRLAAAGYSLVARTVEDGAITTAKLAPDAITPALVPPLDAGKITTGQLDPARLPDGLAQAANVEALETALAALTTRVAVLELGGGGPAGVRASLDPEDAALLGAGYQRFATLAGGRWRAGAVQNAPSARTGHSAVWTPAGWLVWGGRLGNGQLVNTGAGYDPLADAWSVLSTANPPTARADHTAVFAPPDSMIVWGGRGTGAGGTDPHGLYPIGVYEQTAVGLWITPAAGLPQEPDRRHGHLAVWCAGRMLIWGGQNASGLLNSGALYNRQANSWAALPGPDTPAARIEMAAAVAGNSIFIWGGQGDPLLLGDGAALVLNPDGTPLAWQPMNSTGAPSPRRRHTAVWTGSRLLIWGGQGAGNTFLGDGKSYDPATGTWEDLPSAGAPSPRAGHLALWTGTEMLVLTGENSTGPLASGAAYNPATGIWRPLTAEGNPTARHSATAAWTGQEVIVFGGLGAGGTPLAALERLDPTPAWHLFRKP